jgi:hypothetical protein
VPSATREVEIAGRAGNLIVVATGAAHEVIEQERVSA